MKLTAKYERNLKEYVGQMNSERNKRKNKRKKERKKYRISKIKIESKIKFVQNIEKLEGFYFVIQ